MNIAQAHIEFRQAFDNLDLSSRPDYLPEQVDYILNEATNRFVKTRYSGNNMFRTGFDQTQKRIDDLRTLVQTRYCSVSPYTYGENTFRIDLQTLYQNSTRTTIEPDHKYWFYLRGQVEIEKTGCSKRFIGVHKIYQHDDLNYVLTNPFKKPIYSEPVFYFEDGDLFVVTDGNFNVTNFLVTFLKKPIEVSLEDDITFDLAEHTHKEIIQLAVSIALENISGDRLQTQIALSAGDE